MPRLSKVRFTMTILLILLAAYLIFALVVYANQRSMVYFPDNNMGPPEQYGLEQYNPLTLTSEDGIKLKAWYHHERPGFPLVIYFHGNGGHLGYRSELYTALADAGFGVLAISYRGYGGSEGEPKERGLYRDARAAINHATGTLGVAPSRIILYGESIGSALAVTIAADQEKPLGGVILQAPFTSMLQRAKEIYFYLPVDLLLKERFETVKRIGDMKSPLLILHGDQDRIVPLAHGKALFEAANEPKEIVVLPGIDHNRFPIGRVADEVLGFAREHDLIDPTRVYSEPIYPPMAPKNTEQ